MPSLPREAGRTPVVKLGSRASLVLSQSWTRSRAPIRQVLSPLLARRRHPAMSMKSSRKKQKPVSAESIAHLADREKDVSRFLTNAGKMMPPIQRINIDLTAIRRTELDTAG